MSFFSTIAGGLNDVRNTIDRVSNTPVIPGFGGGGTIGSVARSVGNWAMQNPEIFDLKHGGPVPQAYANGGDIGMPAQIAYYGQPTNHNPLSDGAQAYTQAYPQAYANGGEIDPAVSTIYGSTPPMRNNLSGQANYFNPYRQNRANPTGRMMSSAPQPGGSGHSFLPLPQNPGNPSDLPWMSQGPGRTLSRNPQPGSLTPPSMNNPTPQPTEGGITPMARGGRTRNMRAIHASPSELDYLDMIQGKKVISEDKESPMHMKKYRRMYPGIESLLKNPHIKAAIFEKVVEHHARGGEVGALHPASAANGRFGDTEVALVGPHTLRFLNSITPHPSVNPHDGHPEFFSLQGMLGGLGDTIMGGARRAWDTASPYIGAIGRAALPIASTALQGAVGEHLSPTAGRLVGRMTEGAGNALLDRYAPEANLPGQEHLQKGTREALDELGNRRINNAGDFAPTRGGIDRALDIGEKMFDAYADRRRQQPASPLVPPSGGMAPPAQSPLQPPQRPMQPPMNGGAQPPRRNPITLPPRRPAVAPRFA